MFSTTESLGSYLELTGLAAASIAVLALSVHMIPALATETVYCSIASCRITRVLSSILSNSSMQQIPLSERTRAPLSSTISRVSGSLVMYTVRPTAELPLPEVQIPLGAILWTYCKSCDLAVDGSPQSKMLSSPLNLPLPLQENSLLQPPNN